MMGSFLLIEVRTAVLFTEQWPGHLHAAAQLAQGGGHVAAVVVVVV
jgi:hypothetical protein